MTNIFEALREDHDTQRKLVKDLRATSGDDPVRRDLYGKLKSELDAHAKAEERSLYAEMLGHKASQPVASHSIHEHTEIDKLIAKVDALDFDSPHWIRTFDDLAHKVLHHLEEEEHGVFQMAGKVINDAEKINLVKKFEKHKTIES